jgi:hypothetical protein
VHWTLTGGCCRFLGVSDLAAVRFSLPAQLLEPTPNLGRWKGSVGAVVGVLANAGVQSIGDIWIGLRLSSGTHLCF